MYASKLIIQCHVCIKNWLSSELWKKTNISPNIETCQHSVALNDVFDSYFMLPLKWYFENSDMEIV